MSKVSFDASVLKKGFGLARIVKPESNDYCLKFGGNKLTVFSYDRRRALVVNIPFLLEDEIPPSNKDFFITTDRASLFESDLEKISIKIDDNVLSVSAKNEDGRTRKANLKSRSLKSRRPPVPDFPEECEKAVYVDRKLFEDFIRQASCSSQVKETKTDEDMRVHKLHFYSEHNCALSNARFYGTMAYMEDLELDLSIVANDIPIIRAFCSKIESENIGITENDSYIFVHDPDSKSFCKFAKMGGKKPSFAEFNFDSYEVEVKVEKDVLAKSLSWASVAIEGTQRVTIEIKNGWVTLFHEDKEISNFECEIIKGDGFKADFPVRYFHFIIGYLDKDVRLFYGYEKVPTILVISNGENNGIKAFHFLQSMKSR